MGPGKGFRFYCKYNACEKGLVRSGYDLGKRATELVVDWMWGWKQKEIKDEMQVFDKSRCHSLRWEIWAGNPGFLCFCSLLFCGVWGGDIPVAQNSSITYSWSTFSLWAQSLYVHELWKSGEGSVAFLCWLCYQLSTCPAPAFLGLRLLLCKLGSMGEEAAFSDFCDSIAQTFFLQPQGITALYLVTHVDRCGLHVPLCKMKASSLPDLSPQGSDQGWE